MEDGIPVPTVQNRGLNGERGPKARTPWTQTLDSLQPGQSVLTTEDRDRKAAEQMKIRRPTKKFAIRKVPSQGWRVWRVE